MPRRAPVHGRPEVKARKHTAQQRDQARGTSTQRGYDGSWQKRRLAKLRANPLCEHCESRGRVTPAQDVDHITPFSGKHDPLRLDWDNLQSLCRRCHNRKTARQGKAYPEWMPEPAIPVTVVCGPPASGKTHYARTHAGRHDEVIDLDWIACELSGHDGHDWDRKWLGVALAERNRRLAAWSRRGHGCGWLVVTAPHAAQRDWWRDRLNASVVVMETPAEECATNARRDGRLSDRLRFQVAQWWERYQRDARDAHRRPQGEGGENH